MLKNIFKLTSPLIFLFSVAVSAEPVNFSLIPDVAMHPKDTKIEGFILGVWSENPQSAFALGIVNGSTGNSQGVALAFIGNYSENYTGAHLGFGNYSSGHFIGAQLGVGNYTKKLTGLQFGFVNYAETVDSGVQIGLINIIPETKEWFQNFPKEIGMVFPLVNWRFP